ncbi:50S ribosome-binding GTPase domain-containing protein [Ditylenchus destructor]|nr:50S ribosome-binding GTPase domain-containing protein [Ditylenchus destructor]
MSTARFRTLKFLVNHTSKGQAIPRFVPENIAEATTPPNAAPAANDASVRKAKNDVTSCYSYYFYDLLKTSVLGQESPVAGNGNKSVSSGQGTNKSQRQDVATTQKVRYKKEISMVRGKSIPRFTPEMIQSQTSPNPTPKQNMTASSNVASGTKASGLPAPPANNPSNGPAAPPGVRNPNNDVGILGMPNVAKSTFFNELTKWDAQAKNYPFCTIGPNESRVVVDDSRFNWLVEHCNPLSRVSVFLNIIASGKDKVEAWIIQKGTKAPQAAGRIHTDFEKGFIMAEVMKVADLMELENENAVKGAGKYRQQGKTYIDIAGSVNGASEGQGLGNAFLSHVGACGAQFHLRRSFEVTRVEGEVDPIRDLDIISSELRLKDLAYLDGALKKVESLAVRAGDNSEKPEYERLQKVKEVLDSGKFVRQYDWTEKDVEILNKHLFFTAKPIVYLVNLSVQDYIKQKNKWPSKIKVWIDEHDVGPVLIPFSGALELKVALECTKDALEQIAQLAVKRETGARALRSIVEKVLELAKLDVPGSDIENVTVTGTCVRGEASYEYKMRAATSAASGNAN